MLPVLPAVYHHHDHAAGRRGRKGAGGVARAGKRRTGRAIVGRLARNELSWGRVPGAATPRQIYGVDCTPCARAHDERMDLFLRVCEGLRAGGMRRLGARVAPMRAVHASPTYLSVVVRNLALDYRRSRHGRFRAFTSVARLDETDQLVSALPFPRREASRRGSRDPCRAGAGIQLSSADLMRIAWHGCSRTMSASQRWSCFSRWSGRQPAIPIDPVDGTGENATRVSRRTTAIQSGSCARTTPGGEFTRAVGSRASSSSRWRLRFRDLVSIWRASRS